MSDLAILNMLLLAAEVAVASLILPSLGWALAQTYRRSAAGRRLSWVVVFAMLLALPLLAVALPSIAVIALPAPPAIDPALAAAIVATPVAPPEPPALSWTSLIPLAGAVWLAGLAKIGIEHLVALVRLELMRRTARPWKGPLPIRVRGCQLLVSEECPGPMTWGAFRPVILLPEEALDWPEARLEAALRHELAHVHRRDGLVQALSVAACALYWPNPLVWLAAKALRREAELAADDTVIASGVRPSDYAGQLLELAAEWRERRLTPTGLAMAAPPALSQRVQSILSTDANRSGATAMDTLKLALLGGAATAALILARPSVAEVPASAPAPNPTLQAQTQTVQPAPAQRSDIQVAQQDAPAPPTPPTPPAAAAKPLPPFPGPPGSTVVGLSFKGKDFSFMAITPEQNAELAKIGPAINKAIADAHIDEAVEKALAAQDPKTRALIAKQLADLGPTVQRGVANAQMNDALQQHMAELPPEAQEAFKKAQASSPFPPGQTTTTVPYNAATDDPGAPGYIAPGQPGAQHPVPAKLATLLNSRKAKDGVPGTSQPWTLSWIPAGSLPPTAAGGPGANQPAWLPNPNGAQPVQAPPAPKN